MATFFIHMVSRACGQCLCVIKLQKNPWYHILKSPISQVLPSKELSDLDFCSFLLCYSVFQHLHCLSSYLQPTFHPLYFCTKILVMVSKCLAYILWWQRFVSPWVSQIVEQATEASTGWRKLGWSFGIETVLQLPGVMLGSGLQPSSHLGNCLHWRKQPFPTSCSLLRPAHIS